MNKYEKTYKKLESKLHNGDVIKFQGKSTFANIIRLFTWSKFSHVGLIFIENGVPMILEATKGKGVHSTELKERIKYSEDKKIYIIRHKGYKISDKSVRKFRKKHEGKKYESNYKQLANSANDSFWSRLNKKDTSELFCSELVAQFFIDLGIFEKTKRKPSNEYVPSDIKKGMKYLIIGYFTNGYRVK